jgi:hypothetical protein
MSDINYCTGPLPHHIQVWVRRRFIEDPLRFIDETMKPGEPQMTRAVWFGLVSQPARAWGCTVLLESGAIYRNLPPHAIAFRDDASDILLKHCQHWDCYGYGWSATCYPFLDGQTVLVKDRAIPGTYLFSVQPIGDGWSRIPEQSKEFTFIEMDDGNLSIQPTDRTLISDRSFTGPPQWPTNLRRQTEVFSCE